MSIDQMLLNTPCEKWVVEQVIVFDWYDGPIQGVCRLLSPEVIFQFNSIATIVDDEACDEHLYALYEITELDYETILNNLRVLGNIRKPLWIPTWYFESNEQQAKTEQVITETFSKSIPSRVLLQSRDMLIFDRCWFKSEPD